MGGTFTKIVFWIVVLIGIYLVATQWLGVNSILSTLGNTSLKGIATLQGRQNVPGVTN